jgi:flavodoxin
MLGFIRAGYDATRGKETKIEKTQKLPQDYDLIVVDTPVWNSKLTPAIRAYLKENDLSQKKVALFSSHSLCCAPFFFVAAHNLFLEFFNTNV